MATLLENAGVPEGVAADIVGLYSGGASLMVKREAIEKLKLLTGSNVMTEGEDSLMPQIPPTPPR